MPEDLHNLIKAIKEFGLLQVVAAILVFTLLQQRVVLGKAFANLLNAVSLGIKALVDYTLLELINRLSEIYELMNKLENEFNCMRVAILKIHGKLNIDENLRLSIHTEITGKYENGEIVQPLKPQRQNQRLNDQSLGYFREMMQSEEKDLYLPDVEKMPAGQAKLDLLSTDAKAVYHLYLRAKPNLIYTLILVFNRKDPLTAIDRTKVRNLAHQIRKLLK
ncbi:hypothetical protein AAG747_13995 [Rapidithrix thailandica]|uniref:Uncharacterized protein n=1 Tax=Rapidithrix thailandica TaxID=413964 RepID=A0AAW9S7P6_9BACT